jgi:hypothetical protein
MGSLLPAADDGLELYAAHVAELLLELRDEGHVLSSLDQHLIETWWEAGYPLESVLGAVRVQGPRLKKRKNPPRGLPLRAMQKAVEKAATRSLAAGVGRSDPQEPTPVDVVRPLRDAAVLQLHDADDTRRGPLRLAVAELEENLAAPPGPEQLYASLLGIGRRYYVARLASLPEPARIDLRHSVLGELPDATRTLPPHVLDATVQELSLRSLRRTDPLFDPARFWTAP